MPDDEQRQEKQGSGLSVGLRINQPAAQIDGDQSCNEKRRRNPAGCDCDRVKRGRGVRDASGWAPATSN